MTIYVEAGLQRPAASGDVPEHWPRHASCRRECRVRDDSRVPSETCMGSSQRSVLAVKEAAQRGDVEFLINALADPDMRGSAALRLGDLGAREPVPALIRNLRVRNDLDRNAAVKALGKIGDPSAISALLEVAEEDEAAGVRTTAIDSAAMLNSPRGVELLTELAIDPSPLLATCSRNMDVPIYREMRPRTLRRIRKWAAKRLRELHATEAVPTLAASLGSVDLRHSLRLRRTIRSLRRSTDSHPSDMR